MSQISKALKKVQELRQNEQFSKETIVAYVPSAKATLTQEPVVNIPFAEIPVAGIPTVDRPEAASKNNLIPILAIGTAAAILISIAAFITMMGTQSGQNKVLGLAETIKIQDKKISDLTTAINKDQKFSDSQMRDMKAQVNDLASSSKHNYDSLKEAIVDDKQEISFLDNYTKKLEQKIQAMTVSINQAQAAASPANGT